MNRALDTIFWRRWLYCVFAATTFFLAASPVCLEWEVGAPCVGLACLLDPVCEFPGVILPNFTIVWLEALGQNLGWFLLFAVLYAILGILKHLATVETVERATAAWYGLKFPKQKPPDWKPTPTSRLRAVSAGKLGRAARKLK